MSDLDLVASKIAACTGCGLSRDRTKTVPGVGPQTARIVFVGEGPGEQEDTKGEPFVGQAGQLLNRMFRDAGIRRADVFITNVVKCRPPRNRDPSPTEVQACKPFLGAQIALIRPKVIVTLGKHAAWHLTGHYGPISGLMQQPGFVYGGLPGTVPVIVCYHPAYLLRLLQTDKETAKGVYRDFVQRFREAQKIAAAQTSYAK